MAALHIDGYLVVEATWDVHAILTQIERLSCTSVGWRELNNGNMELDIEISIFCSYHTADEIWRRLTELQPYVVYAEPFEIRRGSNCERVELVRG